MPNNRPDGQRPKAEANQIIDAARRDLHRLTVNSKGKAAYMDDFDYIFKEIYGVKNLCSRFLSKKKGVAAKAITKINIESLLRMLLDEETTYILRQMALVCHKVDRDSGLTSKEVKKYEKYIKTVCSTIRNNYGIKKLKDVDDIDLKALGHYIERYDDDDYFGGYGSYDDDDDYGYGYDYDSRGSDDIISELFGSHGGKRAQATSALAAVYNKADKRRNSRYDDDDDDEEVETSWDKDDDEFDDDERDALVEVLGKLYRKVDDIERRQEAQRYSHQNIYPLPEEPSPAPQRVPVPPVNSVDPGIAASLDVIKRACTKNSGDIRIIANSVGSLSEQVDKLTGICGEIYRDFYESQPDDIDDEVISDGSSVSNAEIADMLGNPSPQPTQAPPPQSSPVNIKELPDVEEKPPGTAR